MRNLFQISKSQTIQNSLLVIIIMCFSTTGHGYAKTECSPWLEMPILNLNCWFKTDNQKSVNKNRGKAAEFHFIKMVDSIAQELVKSVHLSIKAKDIEEQLDKELNQAVIEVINLIDWPKYTQSMTDKLRLEFKAMMGSLFDKKIRLLCIDIDKVLNSIVWSENIETIIANQLKQIDQVILNIFKHYNQIINNTNSKLRAELMTQILEQVTQLQNKTIQQITLEPLDANSPLQVNLDNVLNKRQPQLIKRFSMQLDQLRQAFRQEMSYFLDKSEYFMKRINCTVETTLAPIIHQQTDPNITKMAPFSFEITMNGQPLPIASASGNVSIQAQKDEEDTTFKFISEPLFCYQELGLQAPPEPWEYSTWYDLKKCHLLHTLTPETPVKRILNVYLDLKSWAAKMTCIQHGAGHHATQHYIWDWLEFGYLYNLWYTYY